MNDRFTLMYLTKDLILIKLKCEHYEEEIARLRAERGQLLAALKEIAVGGANEIQIARAALAALAAVEEKPCRG